MNHLSAEQEAVLQTAKDLELPTDQISDGDHTFGQLYDHRVTLWIALCRVLERDEAKRVWRSQRHSDGSPMYKDWFLLGMNKEKGEQITYHIPIKYWEECEFAEDLYSPPEFDGHSSKEVLERISQL